MNILKHHPLPQFSTHGVFLCFSSSFFMSFASNDDSIQLINDVVGKQHSLSHKWMHIYLARHM